MKRFASVPARRAVLRARWERMGRKQRTVVVACAVVVLLLVALAAMRHRIGNWLWPDSKATELRVRAEQALRAGRISSADGTGARELYEAALAIQPDQLEAQAGLGRVALAALAQAERAAVAGRFDEARAGLQLARELEAPRERAAAVAAMLGKREAAHAGIDALLARAEAAHAAGHLDDGDNAALPLLQRVLAVAPRNQRAVEAREDALTDLLHPARDALRAGDALGVARRLRRAEAFDPGHVDLPELRAGLARLLERRQQRLQALVTARRYEPAAETCLLLREASDGAALPSSCSSAVVAELASRAKAFGEDFDIAASTRVIALARALAADDPRVREAERELAQARLGARRLPQPARDPKRAAGDVRRLLADAARAQARGDWLTPPGESAWDKLRAARALAPADPRVRAASRAMEPAAQRCHADALRDNDLRQARTCFDAWRQLDPADPALPQARQRMAQRWIAIGGEWLESGQVAKARHALDEAEGLDPRAPGLAEFAERMAKAQ